MATENKLFEQIEAVWKSSPELTTETKPDSIYMASRFISLSPHGFLAASELNKLRNLPPWASLPYLKYSTPTRPAPRNKYPKKLVEAPKLSERRKRALSNICRKFNVKAYHGSQIMILLEQQGFVLEAD